MKMSRKRFYQVSAIVVFIAGSLLIGFLVWRSWAIQNAIPACNPAYGLQPVKPPTEFQAKLTTYRKAEQSISNLPAPERPVWVVEMKGRWMLIVNPPADPSNPRPFYTDKCTIIVDARTGKSLSLIRKEKAIQLAVQSCPGYGLQLVGQPTEFQADLTTSGMDNKPVWNVTVKGDWLLVGGPLPDPASNPEPSYWNACSLTIDARTGKSLTPPIE
jgi:hypothetical protein